MNIKLTPVVLAVAMSLSPPVLAQTLAQTLAQAEKVGSFYGSVRIGLEYQDLGAFSEIDGVTGLPVSMDPDATINTQSYASRFGFRGESKLANGLTGFGHYELGIDLSGSPTVRHANVGIKDDFGLLMLGQAHHTFYNTVVGPVDQTWWAGCTGCVTDPGRSQAITYQGNFGSGQGGVSLIFDKEDPDGDDLDGFEVGATFPIGGFALGLGMQDLNDGTEATYGITLSGASGSVNWALNYMSQDAASNAAVGTGDTTGYTLFAGFGNTYLNIGRLSSSVDSLDITLGYTKAIGENTLAWFELSSDDTGIDGDSATNTLRTALKFDWN